MEAFMAWLSKLNDDVCGLVMLVLMGGAGE